MTRKQIGKKIHTNSKQINKLKLDNRNLYLQSLLTCDKEQWFKEEIETVKVREGRKFISKECLIGKVYWNEYYLDEDTGKKVKIERETVVKKDGVWIV